MSTAYLAQEQEKEKIAALAAAMVQDGSTIMINGGTTTLALARSLGQHRELTVATNNLLVPGALPPSAIRDIYVFGGAVRALTLATIGPVSFRAVRVFRSKQTRRSRACGV